MSQRRASRLAAALFLAVVVIAVVAGYAWYWTSEADARTEIAMEITGGDPARAPAIMLRSGCAGCHEIPGVPMAMGKVGPSLAKVKEEEYIGGVLTNTPENMVQWVSHARDIDPKVAMPNTNLTDQDARDVAAYLYALP